MDDETRLLRNKGIAAIKRGDRAEAHRLFLQLIERQPDDPSALVYAGLSAPDEEQAEAFLRAAQKLNPDHPDVRRGWKLHARRKTASLKHAKPSNWLARRLQKKKSPDKPGFWLIAAGTLILSGIIVLSFLALVIGTFYYLNVLRPTARLALLQPTETDPAAPLQSRTPSTLPSAAPTSTSTATQIATLTATATDRPSPSPSATPSLSPLTATDQAYPPVSFLDFSAAPRRYAGQPLRLTGVVVGYGEARLDGELTFSLLLGPSPDEVEEDDLVITPLVVLGIAPDVTFDLDVLVTIYGIGGEEIESLTVQGVGWKGPVLLGQGVFEIQ